MKVSLVLCTLGRDVELRLFLDSLINQSFNSFELIIVDQNDDDRVLRVLDDYGNIKNNILYLKSDKKGLSKARNVGLKYCTGGVIAFPDDDCIYGENLLATVVDFFKKNEHKYSVFCTNTKDPVSEHALIDSPSLSCEFNQNKLLGCSFTLFFTNDAANYSFDERLGVGSGFIWGASEEVDFLYRFLSHDRVAFYSADTWVYHPAKEHQSLDLDRAYYYGGGFAAYRAKNFSKFRCFKSAILLIYKVFTFAILGKIKRSIFTLYFLLGYLFGLLAWKICNR